MKKAYTLLWNGVQGKVFGMWVHWCEKLCVCSRKYIFWSSITHVVKNTWATSVPTVFKTVMHAGVLKAVELYFFFTFTYTVFTETLLWSCPLDIGGLLVWMFRLDIPLNYSTELYHLIVIPVLKSVPCSHHRAYQSKVSQATVGCLFWW